MTSTGRHPSSRDPLAPLYLVASAAVLTAAALTAPAGFAHADTYDEVAARTEAVERLVSALRRSGTELYIEGVNVQVKNLRGQSKLCDGRGNVVVGYNEPGTGVQATGSHNLVLGRSSDYRSHGGIVSGAVNTLERPDAVAVGGYGSRVRGLVWSFDDEKGSVALAAVGAEVRGIGSVAIAGNRLEVSGMRDAGVSGYDNAVSSFDGAAAVGGAYLDVTPEFAGSQAADRSVAVAGIRTKVRAAGASLAGWYGEIADPGADPKGGAALVAGRAPLTRAERGALVAGIDLRGSGRLSAAVAGSDLEVHGGTAAAIGGRDNIVQYGVRGAAILSGDQSFAYVDYEVRTGVRSFQ